MILTYLVWNLYVFVRLWRILTNMSRGKQTFALSHAGTGSILRAIIRLITIPDSFRPEKARFSDMNPIRFSSISAMSTKQVKMAKSAKKKG